MKVLKKVVIVMFLMMLVVSTSYMCYADNSNFETDSYENEKDITEISNVTDKAFGTVYGVVRIAGMAISIVILLVIACKYMIASPGERADLKKSSIPYVIGVVIFFGTTGIIKIIAQFADSL